MSSVRTVLHGRVELVLHELQAGSGSGRPLLLLHGLGERTPSSVPPGYEAWTGPILGLDFTGHGGSTIPKGGGYGAEILMADADAALGELGPCTVAGRGLGAYVAVLLAGARPTDVRGTILRDGPGLVGGGITPTSPHVAAVDPDGLVPPDPWALAELTRDPRPPDYATSFVRQATHFSDLAEPVAVCAIGRPPWLEAVVAEPGVRVCSLAAALEMYGSA